MSYFILFYLHTNTMQELWIRENFWSEAIAGIAKTLSEHRFYLLLYC